jgi:hypothetical protein
MTLERNTYSRSVWRNGDYPSIYCPLTIRFRCFVTLRLDLLQFDVTTDKGLAAFNGLMGSKSYVEGYSMSAADTEAFAKFEGKIPDSTKLPHAYRWYIHIAALSGVRGIALAPPTAAAPAAATPAPALAKKGGDDDDFDVFGDDDDEEEEAPKESRADMLARLKKEAEERTAQKEAKQRTLVAIEIKVDILHTVVLTLNPCLASPLCCLFFVSLALGCRTRSHSTVEENHHYNCPGRPQVG